MTSERSVICKNALRCYLEPMVHGTKRIFLPDSKELKFSSSSLYDQSGVHLFPTQCTLSVTAHYECSSASITVEGAPLVYIDKKPTKTEDRLELPVGSVFEIHPGALVYILEVTNIRKECINLTVGGTFDRLRLKARIYKWEMFTGGQLFTMTSAGFDDKRVKVASFDLDGTLIKSKTGGYPKDHEDWTVWDNAVKPALSNLHRNGYKVIIFTNQAGILKSETSLNLHFFKMKIENVVNELGCPIQVFIAAFLGGPYRKPVPGMWRLMEWNCGASMDLERSFYVGDAAGRSQDFSASDRIFADNIGIKFYSPEEFFLNEPPAPHSEVVLRPCSFDINVKMPDLDVPSKEQEVIIMVGPPSSGKTVFVETYLIVQGYVPVSLDYFDDWELSVPVLDDILHRKKNTIIDHRNWQISDRWKFVSLCKSRKIKVRCFLMDWSINRCAHNNKFRKIFELDYESVSPAGFEKFKQCFEMPTKEEGFDAILNIPFIPTFKCNEMKFFYNCYLHAK